MEKCANCEKECEIFENSGLCWDCFYASTSFQEEDDEMTCERCGKTAICEEVPLMGYSEWLCENCGMAAYKSGEAV